MTDAVCLPALYRLLTFVSPAFPIGAFTYSHGLEQVIDEGGVACAADLSAWLEDILRFGAGRGDAILLKETWRAALAGSRETVEELRDLGLALQPSKERHLESSAQGTAFFNAVAKSWTPPGETAAGALFRSFAEGDREPWPYPVALGLVAAAHAIPEKAAVTAFLHAFTANIISVAVRAVPLGQSDGQGVLAGLEPVVFDVADEAVASGLDDLGTSTFLADIASMAHETQYSRLFRS
ncbi:urease accessory protein UreF [Roseibium salinum]|uniref:Urease accessory protein UreF n=1 Tax=Roseibium salinum TaxID=1604349 RepID=A0ABT3R6S3_9HYPH|nr:urease accessory protein UreF [Roseibium sp. DSM 29163]MCX2724849.1 urease accessory protein UreF [Roseibium sp. DSM 29163]